MNDTIIQQIKDLGPKITPLISSAKATWTAGFVSDQGYVAELTWQQDNKPLRAQVWMSPAEVKNLVSLEQHLTLSFSKIIRNMGAQTTPESP